MTSQATTYRVPGAILIEREHTVPLDHADPDGAADHASSRARSRPPTALDRPYLLFLQGGPGFEAARPTSPPTGWMKRALADYRVLLLDQRGTGRSTPVGPTSRATRRRRRPTYLTHFRADSIVRDAELIRAGARRSSAGACSARASVASRSMTYLSIAPEGLREAFITGGLSPIGRPVDDIYGATYRRLDPEEPRATSRATRTTGRGSATSSAGSRTRTSGCRRATG